MRRFLGHANPYLVLLCFPCNAEQPVSDENEYSVSAQLQKIADDVQQLAALDKGAEAIANMLVDASIQIQEASRDLNYYQQSIDLDPVRGWTAKFDRCKHEKDNE